MRKPDQTLMREKPKLRKGLWSPEEDEKLMKYMLTNGQGCWSDIARNAGLLRCGKSCRLRWINYLRPDLKRGAFSPQEEEFIIHLHSILGNSRPVAGLRFSLLGVRNISILFSVLLNIPKRKGFATGWSQIAARMPGRTDNEIKNFWNSTIKKRLKNITNNNNNSTSSPNMSDTLSDPSRGIMGTLFPMQEQDIFNICMDTSSTSSISMQLYQHQSMLITGNNHFNPCPLLGNNFDVVNGMSNHHHEGSCLDQIMAGDGGLVEDYGVLEPYYMMGLETELSVPELESGNNNNRGVENNGVANEFVVEKKTNDNSNQNVFNGVGESIKVEDMVALENHWPGHTLKTGDLDWETLLANVPSLSCLDYQID
ncbi:hypothetical protein Leryth_001446 [Lithospermum erythrorhizon]|nr:hypothetical protein Leryth_001446 [Lithospermum erythrorhizon]